MVGSGAKAQSPRALQAAQCHTASQVVWLFAHFGGGGGGGGATPSQLIRKSPGLPVGVMNVLPEYCMLVLDAGSGVSQAPEYGVPAVMQVLLNQCSASAIGAETPEASFSPHTVLPQPRSGRMKRLL